jgi:SAM-dependent methyltransferase
MELGMSKIDPKSNDDVLLRAARNQLTLFEKVVEPEFREILSNVREFTMCSMPALYDLYKSLKYVNQAGVPGDILEVGCWKGGALGLVLAADETKSRRVFGFDTFEGHLQPPEFETDIRGSNMRARWQELADQGLPWNKADYLECTKLLSNLSHGRSDLFRLIVGDIKVTSKEFTKLTLSILRIDCDWYEESLVSLETFWPMVSSGGILILDDYGHHPGQKRAADEFFSSSKLKFTHVDYSCVAIQKP